MDVMQQVTTEGVVKVLDFIDGDGHTIFRRDSFNSFLPDWMLEMVREDHTSSDSNPKGMIFGPDGKVIPSVSGIYGLRLLNLVSSFIGAEPSDKMGRGFAARDLTKKIRARLDEAGFKMPGVVLLEDGRVRHSDSTCDCCKDIPVVKGEADAL